MTYWPAPWSHPRYKCLEEIAYGEHVAPRRYSRIFLAVDRENSQIVVIKQSRRNNLSLDEQLAGEMFFKRESGLLRGLNHPHLVHLRDFFQEGWRMHLVVEWIDGASLEEYLLRQLPPLATLCRWGIQICEVLTYLHSQSEPIIHRDIKPGNIMLNPRGDAIVIDLSIARRMKSDSFVHSSLTCFASESEWDEEENAGREIYNKIGTKGYAPPEQYQGQSTFQSDLYSLGVLLHQCLSGENPTKKDHPWSFSALPPSLPRLLVDLIADLTHPTASARPTNAYEVQCVLQEVLDGVTSGHERACAAIG